MNHRATLHCFFFVVGILLGYGYCTFFNQTERSVKKKRRQILGSNSDWLQTEILRLHSSLEAIQQQLQALTSYLGRDQLDAAPDEFYDTQESLENGVVEQMHIFKKVDQMFEDSDISKKFIYDYLNQHIDSFSDNPNFLWRMAKAAHFVAKSNAYQNEVNSTIRKDLYHEAFGYAKQALELDEKNADCHKWYAITIGSLSEFASVKEKINYGTQFKTHLDIAMGLKKDDPTLYHLAGRFCLELLQLSWLERKMATAFLGALPQVTHEDALQYFSKAYHLKPLWKENILYLVQMLLSLKQPEEAKTFIERGLSIPSSSEDSIHQQLVQLNNSLNL